MKQQIEKEAQEYADRFIGSTERKCRRSAFMDGANFALSHQWVSVEEQLPELGQRVLVYRKQGDIECIFIAKRIPHDTTNADDMRWHWTQVVYDSEIKAWCAIPQLNPEKEVFIIKLGERTWK